MPFAIGDLAAIVGAWVGWALAISAAAVVGWLAARIPDPSIVGIHPLGFVQTLLKDIEHFFLGLAQASGNVLHDAIAGLTYIDSRLFQLVAGVLGLHASQLDHIAGSVVPAAVADANRYTNRQVAAENARANQAERDARAAGAAAAAAAVEIRRLIGHVNTGTVSGDITTAERTAEGVAHTYTDSQARALTSEMQSRLAGVWSAIGPLQTAVSSTIPHEIQAEANRARAYADADAAKVVAQLTAEGAHLQDQLDTLRGQLGAATATADQAAADLAAADLSTAEGRARASQAAADARAAAGEITVLQSTISGVQGQADALGRQLDDATATTTISLPALPDVSIPSTVSVPIAVGALATAVAGVLEEVDSCMITDCGSGPNQLGNALQRLLGNVATLADLAFVAEAVKDPTGTANALSPLLATIDHGAQDLWSAVLELA